MSEIDNDARLQRIEKKIDQMSEAMIALARAEEKLISIEKNNQSIHMRLDRQAEKIENLEKMGSDNNRTVIVVNRVFWLIMSALVTLIAFKLQ